MVASALLCKPGMRHLLVCAMILSSAASNAERPAKGTPEARAQREGGQLAGKVIAGLRASGRQVTNSRVTVIGAGRLGLATAGALRRAGVGDLSVVDGSPQNLVRAMQAGQKVFVSVRGLHD